MVRVAGLMEQVAAGVTVRSPDGRTRRQALAEIRERVLDAARPSRRGSGRDELARARGRRDRGRASRGLAGRSWRSSSARFDSEIFPVLTPLAVGPGQPFPYISGLSISLGVFVRDPETGEERFARVKVPEGLPRFLADRRARPVRAARAGDRALPAVALPRHGGRRALGVPRHAGRRLRGLRRGRRPARGGRARAAPPALRRVVRVEVVGSMLARDARAAAEAASRRATTRSTRSTACSTSPSSTSWRRSTGPS